MTVVNLKVAMKPLSEMLKILSEGDGIRKLIKDQIHYILYLVLVSFSSQIFFRILTFHSFPGIVLIACEAAVQYRQLRRSSLRS